MKFSPEVRERAVRMMFESRPDPPSLWAAVESIAAQIGCSAQTLHAWVRQHERSTGQQDGPTSSEQQRIKALEREVKERRKANAILRRTRADFAQAELDRRWKSQGPSSTSIARPWGSSRSAQVAPRPIGATRPTGATRRNSASLIGAAHGQGGTRCWRPLSSGSGRPTFRSTEPTRSGVRSTAKAARSHDSCVGSVRGKAVRVTVSDAPASGPLDRVNRPFKADRPNPLWVSDFTDVSAWQG